MRIRVNPYRWWPDHTSSRWETPAPGSLVGLSNAVWTVGEAKPKPADLWTERDRELVDERGEKYAPVMVILHFVAGKEPKRRELHLRTYPGLTRWDVYRNEHFPMCGRCGEPSPCREREGQRIADREMKAMSAYETPGVCPACRKPVTARQKSMTWQDNVRIPGGAPVTFHVGKRECRWGAVAYEKEWAAADPTRRTTMSCLGHVINHGDGSYECSAGDECRGPEAQHDSYASCDCSQCNRDGRFDCHPAPTAVRRGGGDLFDQGGAA